MEEDTVAKRKVSVYFFGGNRDAAITSSSGHIPIVRYLLQHSRRNDWRCVLLGDNEEKKASVKRNGTVIY